VSRREATGRKGVPARRSSTWLTDRCARLGTGTVAQSPSGPLFAGVGRPGSCASPHSSGDRATASGAVCAGSNPAGGAGRSDFSKLRPLKLSDLVVPASRSVNRPPTRQYTSRQGSEDGPSATWNPTAHDRGAREIPSRSNASRALAGSRAAPLTGERPTQPWHFHALHSAARNSIALLIDGIIVSSVGDLHSIPLPQRQ
jgi:hypothetical protein